MAFVQTTLRSTQLTYGGQLFTVDEQGLVELPEVLAQELVQRLSKLYRPADRTQAPVQRRAETAAELQACVAQLEQLLVQQRREQDEERTRLHTELSGLRFQLEERERRLAELAGEQARLQEQVAELPRLRRELAASHEQVQLLLRRTVVDPDTKPNQPLEAPEPAAEPTGRKGKTR